MKKICLATAATLLLATSAFAQNDPENNLQPNPGGRTVTHARRGADVARPEPNREPGMTTGMARSPRPTTIAPGAANEPNTEEGLTGGSGGSGSGGM
jgi:hypothetical protein